MFDQGCNSLGGSPGTGLSNSDIVDQLAAFPSTYFYAHFRISHKKTLDGNGKMRINSKNAHKKLMRTFE